MLIRPIFWALYLAMFPAGSIRLFDGIYAHHLILLLLLVMSIVHLSSKGRLALPSRFSFYFLLFILSVLGSFFANADREAIRLTSQMLIFYFGVFLTYFTVDKQKDLVRLLEVINAGLAINAFAGLLQSLTWIIDYGFVLIADGKWFRVTGLCVSPADYVMQLVVGLLLTDTLVNSKFRNFLKLNYVTLLLISMSRAAMVVLAIIGLIYLLRHMRDRNVLISSLALCFVLSIVVYATDFGYLILSRFIDVGNFDFNVKRFTVYEDVLSKIRTDSFSILIGNGYGTYSFYHPIDEALYDNTHNLYLHLLYSSGLVGLTAFTISAGYLAISSYKSWRASLELSAAVKEYSYGWPLVILHVCVWSIAFVETNIPGVGNGWLLGSVFGVSLVISRNCNRRVATKISGYSNNAPLRSAVISSEPDRVNYLGFKKI